MDSGTPPDQNLQEGLQPLEKANQTSQSPTTSSDHSSHNLPPNKAGPHADQASLPSSVSSLSVNAQPFECSWSNKSGSAQLSALAVEFVPKSFVPAAVDYTQTYQEAEVADYGEQYAEGDKDPLLEYAFQVLYEITCSPGHFSHLCDQLVSTLNSWPTLDQSVLQILVDEIISQAIREPNFRYNGARLCNAISRQLQMTSPVSYDFRAILFNSCKLIHEDRKNLMQSDAENLRGFALFMSELFVHMSPKGGSGRFRLLGMAVRELLQTLLDHPTPANVKCLCQILKLSGSYIEDDDKESHMGKPVDMDDLMMKIDHVARTVDMQMHMKDLLRNMIELRASDWGRAPTSPVARENHQQLPPAPPMGVFYGPDGQVLTAEETEFLNQGMNRHEEEEDFDYADDEDTGMDDEMAEAFEKFLMMQDALK